MPASNRIAAIATGLATSSALAAIGFATPALANAVVDATPYNEIVVTGETDGYLAIDSVTATKIDTKLLDTPQTVNVITAEQISDQAMRSMEDVLRYVPGVTIGQGEGNRDQITLRGQNTTADFFLDGVRDDVQYYRNLYNIERVEVLKGPYALIFGRGGGGGIVNRVQKAPSAEGPFGGAGASVNTFGAWETSADVNLPISGTAAVRVNGFYEELANHRDFYDGKRFAVNPHVAAELGDWRASLSYEYVDDDRTTDRGIPSQNGAPATGLRDFFFGVDGVNRTELEAHIVKARIDGKLAPGLRSTTTVLYGDYDKYYQNVYASGSLQPDNTVALGGYRDPTQRENFIAQTNIIADFATGAVGHKVLLGVEYGDQQTVNQRYTSSTSLGSISIDSPVRPVVTFDTLSTNRESQVRFVSAYAQDEIALGEMFDLILGVRYDRFEIEGEDIAGAFAFERTDEKWSPRAGLVFKPQDGMSLYASYSRSFLPRSGDQFTSLSPSTANLEPTRFENIEAGVKWEVQPGLALTAAAFRLDRTNTTTPDPANPANSINVGETRTKGVELGLVGKVMPGWQISGGYAFQKGTISGLDNRELAQLPRHQASLWNRYDVDPALGIGLGVVHQSSQYASIGNAVKLPSFTRVDAALFYTLNDRIEFQVNVENLLDETYYSAAHNDNNIMPGAPINARFSARVKF
ncbi:TonB-dependent siderophore receptor [Croceicoccus ponticola]|uniref:TonB-dependent siderophore receptor n=1 Tax=Croceicoccus ponticola TaxID=2217664 RepID=A0A437GXF6_9SPHN|nr:TonB-dependent siderophore receptor [Croceicoccus ponticola]RVQ65813.1 TonB-dependent siderophore receptor [Croceicoccus ponticola]